MKSENEKTGGGLANLANLANYTLELAQQTSTGHPEAIAEHLAERAAIMEYDGGLPREQAEAEARRITHAYRYKLHGNSGGGTYITSGDLEAARAALLKRYGDRLALVALA